MPTNVITSYPGVYIEELFTLSLSVSTGATAVPIFADNENADDILNTAQRCGSWLEFLEFAKAFEPRNHMHRSLRAYFENGGGPCYLVKASKMLEEVGKFDDITLLVSAGWDISDAVAKWCQPGSSRFAILDGPKAALTASATWPATRRSSESKTIAVNDHHDEAWEDDVASLVGSTMHAAAYYPYLLRTYNWEVEDDDGVVTKKSEDLAVPPSAIMAGLYCAVDRNRGVWKAPANVSVSGAYRMMHAVTDEIQGKFNTGIALNMFRHFRNSGLTAWGARTMQDNDNWRYVPVRRLFDTAERDIKRAMQFAVFEPNTAYTWTRVKAAVEAYLHNIWQLGGLQGARPEQGYFVQIGEGLTMTKEDIDNGRMIVKIGMAAARPAEFIILQFTQDMEQN